jgi:hypothetical protein
LVGCRHVFSLLVQPKNDQARIDAFRVTLGAPDQGHQADEQQFA